MYDSKARIADVAKDFGDYLKLQKTPPAVSVKDVQAGYLERPGVKPGWETARARGYFLDGLQAEASVFPRDMFGYLERDAFAPRAGFTITYSQKFPDAFVVTGKDGEGTADLYVLGLRNDKGSAVVRMRAPWAEGTRAASDGARNAISAVACSTRFGRPGCPAIVRAIRALADVRGAYCELRHSRVRERAVPFSPCGKRWPESVERRPSFDALMVGRMRGPAQSTAIPTRRGAGGRISFDPGGRDPSSVASRDILSLKERRGRMSGGVIDEQAAP